MGGQLVMSPLPVHKMCTHERTQTHTQNLPSASGLFYQALVIPMHPSQACLARFRRAGVTDIAILCQILNDKVTQNAY